MSVYPLFAKFASGAPRPTPQSPEMAPPARLRRTLASRTRTALEGDRAADGSPRPSAAPDLRSEQLGSDQEIVLTQTPGDWCEPGSQYVDHEDRRWIITRIKPVVPARLFTTGTASCWAVCGRPDLNTKGE